MRDTISGGRDIVIIGGGHNGLVTAFYLAKAGFKPLVLERQAQVGGSADHRRIPSRLPLLHARACRRPHSYGHRARHATGKAWPPANYAGDLRHRALARRPGAFPVSGREQVRAVNRRLLAKRRGQVSRVREISGKNQRGDRGGAGHHAARHRSPRQRRSLEHAQDRPRPPQSRQARYVPRPALGSHGGGRPGSGMLRDRIIACCDSGSRNLRNFSRAMVRRQQLAVADSRGGRLSSRGVDILRRRWNGRTHPSHGFRCASGRRQRSAPRPRSSRFA